MSNKNQAENAQGAKPATSKANEVKTVTDLLKQRLEHYGNLHSLVKTRANLQAHLDKLNALKITEPISPFQESDKTDEKIILHLGYRDEYEIKNPTLLKELREFLVQKITVKMVEIESEILKAAI